MNVLAAVARGDMPADLVIHNARIANVYSLSYELADVAVYSGKIAGIGDNYSGKTDFDAQGKVLIPSLIDGHIHIEDTMLMPQNFAVEAVKHGTGTVMADPHEIANALGMAGLEYMFGSSQGLPIDVYYGAPSCVPASEFETPYQELDMTHIKSMFDRKITQHLGEMMNFPAVIAGNPEAWGKILAAGNVPLTGHAPGVTGKALNAYMSSGINSDHECTDINEAREKLSRGMWLMIREGASFRDLKTLLPIIRDNPLNAARCMVVSDDITARYLVERGHQDVKMRIMLNEGIDPLVALRMLTLSPAAYFRLYDRGAVAPGLNADFALLASDAIDKAFTVSHVWKSGRLVMSNGNVFAENTRTVSVPAAQAKVTHIPMIDDIRVPFEHGELRVIGLTEGSALTKTLILTPRVIDGCVEPAAARDIAKVVVLERHRNTGKFGVGFVQGLGLRSGALGSSVAHDAHNFIVAGMDDVSIITALRRLADIGGGLIAVDGERVLGELALPVGGLMCEMGPHEVCGALRELEESAYALGVSNEHVFMVMSFLCLSVIPELRISCNGYVDINNGGRQELFSK